MRYSRKIDKKIKGAESRSKYYVKYGNPNYGNLKGLISNSRRKQMKEKQLTDAEADLFENEEQDDSGRKLVAYNIGKYSKNYFC